MRKSESTYKKIVFSHFNYVGHHSYKISKKKILASQMNGNINIGLSGTNDLTHKPYLIRNVFLLLLFIFASPVKERP